MIKKLLTLFLLLILVQIVYALEEDPTISITANPTTATTYTTINVKAKDYQDNAGINWVKLYKNDAIYIEKDCAGVTPCAITKLDYNRTAPTHVYYAIAEDISGNKVRTNNITVDFIGNDPPSIQPLPDITVDEGNLIDLTSYINATDPDGDNLTFNISHPFYANLIYQTNYSDAGIYNISVRVYDPSQDFDQENFTLTINDKSPLAITLNSPANDTETNVSDMTFNCSATSFAGNLTNITLYTNTTGAWLPNQTNIVSGLTNETNFTINSIPDGTYIWNCLATESVGDVLFAEDNYTFTVDTTAPSVTNLNPAGNSFDVNTVININATITDLTTVSSAKVNITLPNGTIQQLTLTENNNTYNTAFTIPMQLGLYNVLLIAEDQFGYINNTETTNFTAIDSNSLVITSIGCIPSIANLTQSITCNATATDDFGVHTVLANVTLPDLTVASQTVTNVSSDYSFTFTNSLLPGTYNIFWWVNDTSGNTQNTTDSFIVNDVTKPNVTNLIPTNGSTFNVSNIIEIAADAVDNIAVDAVTAEITLPDSSTVQLILSNTTGNKYNNSYTIPAQLGTYTITFTANDTSNNINSTESTSFTVVNSAPVISNVQNTSITNVSVFITWDTDEPADTSINYGTTLSLGTISSLSESATSHNRTLTGLTQNTLYYYNVTSCDSFNYCTTDGPYSFTTLKSPPVTTGNVIINEIMYDPAGGDNPQEWIEIYNADTYDINISAWSFYEDSTNHALTLVNGNDTLAPGDYAIIAENDITFLANYPLYAGNLFDSSWALLTAGPEYLELRDPSLATMDIVNYSSTWGDDIESYSLELYNSILDNNIGTSWHTSVPINGTPGAANSVPPTFINWSQANINIGTGELGAGDITNTTNITSDEVNTNVNVVCDSGNCTLITDDWTDGTNMIDGQSNVVTFTCLDTTAGALSAVFNVTSNEDTTADQITVTCTMNLPPTYLTGTITNSTSPLNNTLIELRQGAALINSTNTDAAGFYNLSVAYGADYNVTASLVPYINQTKAVTMNGDQVRDFLLSNSTGCVENWGCTGWSSCSGGTETRTCTDSNSCGTTVTKPAESQTCTVKKSSCFPAGTKILMRDNTEKNIEDVNVGDIVIGFDGNANIPVEVLELESPVRDHMYTLSFEDNSTLKLTAEHPLYTKDGWKSISPESTSYENSQLDVEKLEIGDSVLNSEGKYVTITNIDFEKTVIQTYNLKSVSDNNNFYANGFLAHNKGGTTISGETYYINVTKQGVSVELERRDKAVFDFEQQHTATATAVSITTATISLDSESYVFDVGDDYLFDLDNDNVNDLSITLNKILSNKATFLFKLIEEEQTTTSTTTTTSSTTTTTVEEPDAPSRLAGVFREEIEDGSGVGGASMFFKKVIKSPYLKYVGIGFGVLILTLAIISGISNKDKIILLFKKNSSKKSNSKNTAKKTSKKK
ncbi:MAG: lamin tail domain-containing protein [Candidatus Woesearchaeota archaeon]